MTTKVAFVVYPDSSKHTPTGGYKCFYAIYFPANEVIGSGDWTFDFTGYNTHFSADTVVDETSRINNLRVTALHASPWTSQGTWYAASNPGTTAVNGVSVTTTTFKVKQTFIAGTYKWFAVALE